MGAILFSDPFWLMVSKGLLLYDLSTLMPCLDLLWYVPIACCLLALNMASWCYSWHVSIFTKSVKMISFALLPCLIEPALVWFGRSSVSCFVKHLEYITDICFVAMLGCSSLVSCCILDGIVLLIAELCHYCFACHLQIVHQIPVIFI